MDAASDNSALVPVCYYIASLHAKADNNHHQRHFAVFLCEITPSFSATSSSTVKEEETVAVSKSDRTSIILGVSMTVIILLLILICVVFKCYSRRNGAVGEL